MEESKPNRPTSSVVQKLRKYWLRILIGLLLLAWGIYLQSPADTEPTYQGVKLSQLLRTSRSEDELSHALAQIGPAAIPALVKALDRHDSIVNKSWQAIWRKLSVNMQRRLARFHPLPVRETRENAIRGLGGFGPEAESALPALIHSATREHDLMLQAYTIAAIMDIGASSPLAKKFVLEELQSTNRSRRDQATIDIYFSRFMLVEAVPLLLRDLDDPAQRPFNQELALSFIGPAAAAAVPQLVKQLDDPNMPGNPLTALAGIGTNLGPAVPAVIRILQNGKPLLRPEAVTVLMEAGAEGTEALPALALAQQDKNPVIRCLAAMALAKIQNNPALAVPLLVQELQQTKPGNENSWNMQSRLEGPQRLTSISFMHRETAAWLLGDIGPAASPALPALDEALHDRNNWLRPIAARAIFKITGEADVVMPEMLKCLQSNQDYDCFLAMVTLREMGPKARSAIPVLNALKTRNLSLRRAAIETLKRIEADKAP